MGNQRFIPLYSFCVISANNIFWGVVVSNGSEFAIITEILVNWVAGLSL